MSAVRRPRSPEPATYSAIAEYTAVCAEFVAKKVAKTTLACYRLAKDLCVHVNGVLVYHGRNSQRAGGGAAAEPADAEYMRDLLVHNANLARACDQLEREINAAMYANMPPLGSRETPAVSSLVLSSQFQLQCEHIARMCGASKFYDPEFMLSYCEEHISSYLIARVNILRIEHPEKFDMMFPHDENHFYRIRHFGKLAPAETGSKSTVVHRASERYRPIPRQVDPIVDTRIDFEEALKMEHDRAEHNQEKLRPGNPLVNELFEAQVLAAATLDITEEDAPPNGYINATQEIFPRLDDTQMQAPDGENTQHECINDNETQN